MKSWICCLLLLPTVAYGMVSNAKLTAYITVQQDNGVWWFVDGEGNKFFSLGVCCVGGCYAHTEEEPVVPERKAWIVDLLTQWGFNTAAAWSSPSFWDSMYFADVIYSPYHVNSDNTDLFDEAYWDEKMQSTVQREVQPFLGQKNFIGYFIHNEPGWRWSSTQERLFKLYADFTPQQPGGKAFVAFVRNYYQDNLETLNKEWNSTYRRFEDILGIVLPQDLNVVMKLGVVKAWAVHLAGYYYQRYTELVRAYDPNHLIIGIRSPGVPDLDFVRATAEYFDVISINDYNRYGDLKPEYAAIYQLTGKPLLNSEWSFSGYPTPGQHSWQFIDVYSQENRGKGYRKTVLDAARAPYVVGMHWFLWADYTDDRVMRSDNIWPDKNMGLVSEDESQVYQELGNWITKTNAEVPTVHANAQFTPPQQPTPIVAGRLRRFSPEVDGDLSEWPKDIYLKPDLLRSLLDEIFLEDRYYVAVDETYVYLAADIFDPSLEHPGKHYSWQADHLSIQFAPRDRPDERLLGGEVAVYPLGNGIDGREGYAAYQQHVVYHNKEVEGVHVARKEKEGGYFLEAAIPRQAFSALQPDTATDWDLSVRYSNVSGVYQTQWRGVVTLPGPKE